MRNILAMWQGLKSRGEDIALKPLIDAAPEVVPVSAIPRLRRPDALPLVLQEMETARALGIADMKAARRDVQIATGSLKAPGVSLDSSNKRQSGSSCRSWQVRKVGIAQGMIGMTRRLLV
jgi:hypothetical protein